jgi:hypothetical protein
MAQQWKTCSVLLDQRLHLLVTARYIHRWDNRRQDTRPHHDGGGFHDDRIDVAFPTTEETPPTGVARPGMDIRASPFGT